MDELEIIFKELFGESKSNDFIHAYTKRDVMRFGEEILTRIKDVNDEK